MRDFVNSDMHIIDLSHTIEQDISVYPGSDRPLFEDVASIAENGYAEKRLTLFSHHGTHIDAPCHILEGGKTLGDFPVEKFIGRARVVDCRAKKAIEKTFLQEAIKKPDTLDFIIFNCGWAPKWKTAAYFSGYPVLTADAARWLGGLSLKGVGFDTISPDALDSSDLQNHHLLLQRDILIVENLTNLDAIPRDVFTFSCLPLKTVRADGAPVRAVAFCD